MDAYAKVLSLCNYRGPFSLVNYQIKEIIKLGIMKEVDDNYPIMKEVDDNYPRRYLPLLTVTNLERESTKVRICMDSRSNVMELALRIIWWMER